MKLLPRLNRGHDFYVRLWKLSLPIILQNLITFSLGLIDTFMVSQLGNKEMAAVTTANVPVFLLISIAFGIQSGLGILVSQYWGKKDMTSISRALGVAAFMGSAIALVLAILFFLFPVQIMDLLSNKHELSVLGAPYLQLIGFSYVFNMLSSAYASAQRSVENPNFGMKLFGFSTILNTCLNYVLIFGHFGAPALGVTGAAIATLLSRVAEFVICVIYALRCRAMPLILSAFFRPGWEMVRRFLKYASPVILNEAAWGLGNSLTTVILGYMVNSVEMLAANAVMGNLSRLFLVVCFGLGAATAVIVGKAIGEGQSHSEVMDLSLTLLQFTVVVGMVLAAVSLLLIPTVFTPLVFPLFKLEGQSASIATKLAVTAFAAIPLHAYSISAITGVLRSGGDVNWATALDLCPQWLFCLPLTALFALVIPGGGYWPVCIALQVECLLKVPLCIWRVRSGKWIHDVTTTEV
jgi:putative MATE family efflux protein